MQGLPLARNRGVAATSALYIPRSLAIGDQAGRRGIESAQTPVATLSCVHLRTPGVGRDESRQLTHDEIMPASACKPSRLAPPPRRSPPCPDCRGPCGSGATYPVPQPTLIALQNALMRSTGTATQRGMFLHGGSLMAARSGPPRFEVDLPSPPAPPALIDPAAYAALLPGVPASELAATVVPVSAKLQAGGKAAPLLLIHDRRRGDLLQQNQQVRADLVRCAFATVGCQSNCRKVGCHVIYTSLQHQQAVGQLAVLHLLGLPQGAACTPSGCTSAL